MYAPSLVAAPFLVFLALFAMAFNVNAVPQVPKPSLEATSGAATMSARELEAHAIVNSVNAANIGWKAKVYPRFARMSPAELKAMHGLIVPTEAEKKKFPEIYAQQIADTPITMRAEELPMEFDPREKWPKCQEVFNNIRDQSNCGDCWAVAAAGALSDRLCIATDGHFQDSISAIDVASCAQRRFVFFHKDGCKGARDLSPAWTYFKQNGVVTGGRFGSVEGCMPYPFPPSKQAKKREYKTPACRAECTNEDYLLEYEQDKTYLAEPIRLHANNWHRMEHLIMQEVFTNGSIEVGFLIFSDFKYYEGGVYTRSSNQVEGGHAVRLVGWGVDKVTAMPYWLIANSWGPDWGENGFFRIRRGTNEAFIESMTDPFAGTPILNQL